MNFRIPAILAASLSLTAFGAVANTAPQAKVATAEKATGADERLADSVTKQLNKDSALKGSKISVMASNGDITLSGSVKDKSQIAKAETDVKAMAKNGKVTDNLTAAG